MTIPHTHVDEHGLLVRCYHKSKTLFFDGAFWMGVTLSFPIEHFLWEKVWPFYKLTALMGL